MKGKLTLALLAILIFLSSLDLVDAQLSCSVETSCAADNTAIFKISARENGHAEVPTGSIYNYQICCSQPSYTLAASSTSGSCSSGYTEVVRLSADTNAHLQRADYSDPDSAYTTKICLSSPSGVAVTCGYTTQECTDAGYEACLASISGDEGTNAHAGDCDSYSTKICCKLGCAPSETKCDNIDDNCDGTIDEGCDDDNDDYCDSSMTMPDGVTPSTCTSGGGDCNDGNTNINPGKAEICTNGIDDNCKLGTDCTDSACTDQQGPTADGWFGGGNKATAATCGTADDDTSSEKRDYYCTGTDSGETYRVTETKDCDGSDGWYGGGNNEGCGTDDNSVWHDNYVVENTDACESTTTCTGTGTFNCDSDDICNNKCEGTVFISTPTAQETKDYYVVLNTNTCTSTEGTPVTVDCAAKASEDTDAGDPDPYQVGGTIKDYSGCLVTGCTFTAYEDSCSVNTLTEYGVLTSAPASHTSGTKNCEEYETNYCSSDRYYRQEWGCSGSIGYCNDAAVADSAAGINADGDAKDKECGDLQCDNAAGIYDSTKTATETNCADGLDNDCDGTTDCGDSDCDSNSACTASHCSASSTHSVLDSGTSSYRHYYSSGWNIENCATKSSVDSDGSCTAYQTGGTVTDYLACSGGECTTSTSSDSCSETTLTEYCAGSDSSTVSSSAYECQNLESNYCSGTDIYRQEYGCSGTPGYCNDAAVADTFIEDCNLRDGWYCSGATKEYRDYGCSSDSCTYTVTSSEDCATKASTDSDGSTTAYTTAGTVTDYLTCSGGSCTSDSYSDSCSINTLTEYGASAASYTSGAKNCEEYETNYCSSDRYYRQEWGCSGSIGYCNDAAVADILAESDPDGDDVDKSCGDGSCYNARGVCDTAISGKCIAKTATETSCADGLDNDCDGDVDCADTDCAGQQGPNNAICCQVASVDADCGNDDCKIEDCVNNICSIQDRQAGATDECSTCQACDTDGGDCLGISAESGKGCTSDCYDCVSGSCTAKTENDDGGCADDCTYCSSGTCTNRAAGAVDECSTCQACDTDGGDCLGISAETGKSCIADCYDCVSGACNAMTENNDGTCTDDCTKCDAGSCVNRNACDSAECEADKYCSADGGDCKTADENENVCLNCAPDRTPNPPLSWSWIPSNHEDAGKGYNANLFNSDGPLAVCPQSSCTKPASQTDCHCYDTSNNPVNHKSPLGSGNCCGDDASEFYKKDYHGPECTNDINDCVFSDGGFGNVIPSNTGNAQYWCYLHEWNECTDSTIGTKTGESGTKGVTCAGIVSNNAWMPNSLVKPENQYSTAQINACTDGLDNDGDGLKDCEDLDCGGSIQGTVKDENDQPLSSATLTLKKELTTVKSADTDSNGKFSIGDAITPVNCGSYNLIAAHSGYIPQARGINLPPTTQITEDFKLISGTECNDDCTKGKPVSDGIVHSECDGLKGCKFCDETAKAKCDKSQPGWVRDYDAEHYVVCAEGCPQLKVEIKASVDCPSGTLVKVTRIAMYNGKPVKLVVATCG